MVAKTEQKRGMWQPNDMTNSFQNHFISSVCVMVCPFKNVIKLNEQFIVIAHLGCSVAFNINSNLKIEKLGKMRPNLSQRMRYYVTAKWHDPLLPTTSYILCTCPLKNVTKWNGQFIAHLCLWGVQWHSTFNIINCSLKVRQDIH